MTISDGNRPTADIALADLESDPDPILAELRATKPVAYVESMDMWLVTRWDDIAYVEAHPDLFTAATEPSFLARALGPNMLTCDPPAHTRLQDIFQPPFKSGGRSGAFVTEELPAMADALLDQLSSGPFDLMEHYAQPLAAGALAVVLGLDASGFDTMWRWCVDLCGDIANFENEPEATARGARAKEELAAAIQARIDNLDDADLSAIGAFARAGATTEEIVNNVRLMISGGINEPRDGIGLVTWVLLSDTSLRAEADDPARLRRLVEEVFRLHSPVGTVTRMATRDAEVAGVRIAAGDLVSGVLRSANLDEDHWSNPATIDLDRREGTHAAFALGTHRCLGEWLGRQEVNVGVRRLFERFPDIALDTAHDVEIHGFEFRGPSALWVTTG
ncbi:MAG: cytochrome P450 [Actinomycetota bacterium]